MTVWILVIMVYSNNGFGKQDGYLPAYGINYSSKQECANHLKEYEVRPLKAVCVPLASR